MSYDDPTQDLHIHFNKGTQWLSGSDALKVARCRQNSYINESGQVVTYDVYSGADIGRTDTQRNLLVAVLKRPCPTHKNSWSIMTFSWRMWKPTWTFRR